MKPTIDYRLRRFKRSATLAGLAVLATSIPMVQANPPIATLGLPVGVDAPEMTAATEPGLSAPAIRINQFALKPKLPPLNSPSPTPQATVSATSRIATTKPSHPFTPTTSQPVFAPSLWIHHTLQAPSPGEQCELETVIAGRPQTRSDSQQNNQRLGLSAASAPLPQSQDQDGLSVNQRPTTPIRLAASRHRASQSAVASYSTPESAPVLPGYNLEVLRQNADDLIREASAKLDSHAYLTAAANAVDALKLIAQTLDARAGNATATGDLTKALTAIREAEDFVGKYGMVDSAAIKRMVRSHSTEVLKPYDTTNLSGLAAADVYLDWSRRCLTQLASADPIASDALCVMAHAYRLRDGGTPFGLATSVHLMRAASEGQPQNAVLATANHPGRGNPFPATPTAGSEKNRPKEVQLLQVSPQQFAALSPHTAGPTGSPQPYNGAIQTKPQPAVAPANHTASQSGSDTPKTSGSSRFSRAIDPLKRLWH